VCSHFPAKVFVVWATMCRTLAQYSRKGLEFNYVLNDNPTLVTYILLSSETSGWAWCRLRARASPLCHRMSTSPPRRRRNT